jgi:hypothetical protein
MRRGEIKVNSDSAHAMDLSDLAQAFRDAPDGTVPEGTYEATLEKMDLRESNSGNRMVEWTLRIDGPTSRGERVWKTNLLETEEGLKYVKMDLRKCGVDTDKLEITEVPQLLDRLVGTRLLVKVQHKDDFVNVRIKKRLDVPSGNGSASEEDVPF